MCSKVAPRKLRAYICPRESGKLARKKSPSTDDLYCSNPLISIKTRVELILRRSRRIQRSPKRSTKLKKDNLASDTAVRRIEDGPKVIAYRGPPDKNLFLRPVG